jgi:hypothetical protein
MTSTHECVFACKIRRHWAMSNPIDEVNIPSEVYAERIHVITQEEQEEYFKRTLLIPICTM